MMLTGSRQCVSLLMCAVAIGAMASPLAAQVAQPVDSGPVLDPSSPLAPLPDIGIDWPDPEALDKAPSPAPESATPPPPPATGAISPTPEAAPGPAMVDAEAERRYAIALEGLENIDSTQIRIRFDALSVLRQRRNETANVAQINRRAREDEKLLRELLRSEGYYAVNVVARVDVADTHVTVALRVDPGPLFHFTRVEVNGLEGEATSARASFTVAAGDPVNAGAVLGATDKLRTRLLDNGFPFSKVAEPQVVVDHATQAGELTLDVDTGGYEHFGGFTLEGKPLFGPKHMRRLARFHPGDVYSAAQIDDLRRALIATGLVSSVKLTPVPSAQPGVVDISVGLEPAPMRTIAGELGYGTGEGFRAAVSWTHRNMLPPEGAVTFRAVAGTQEQYLGASLRRGNFLKRDQVLTGQIALSHVRRVAYDARSFTLGAGLERQSNIIWQKKWTWSVGTELLVSDERDTIVSTGQPRRRTFYVASLPGTLAYDGSDSLLDPSRGFRLSGRVSPELSFNNGTLPYVRAQIDASAYQPLGDRIVIAGRVRVGTIVGADRDQIAPSRRYYSGGGGSVRGFGYQDIGPRDVNNDPIGGRSISEFALEARVRFGNFGVVSFLDAGNIYTDVVPSFKGLRFGTGLGARYYTSFGPIRLDVGTPIKRRAGESLVAVYVSLGQAF